MFKVFIFAFLIQLYCVQSTDIVIYTKNARPFSEITSNTSAVGYSLDLVQEMFLLIYGDNYDLSIVSKDTNPGMIDGVRTDTSGSDLVIGVAATTITAEREEEVHFLPAFFQSGLRILTPTNSTFFNVLVALMKNTLYTCGTAFFLILFLIFLLGPVILVTEVKLCPDNIEYLFFSPSKNEDGDLKSNIKIMMDELLLAYNWTLYAIMRKECPTPRNQFGKMIKSVLNTIGLLIVIMMTATLTTAMTTDVSNTKIESYDNLSGKDVCTVAETSALTFLQENNHGFHILTQDTIEESVSYMLDKKKCQAVIYDAAILQDVMVERDANGESTHATFVDDYLRTEFYGFFVNESVSESQFEILKQAQISVTNNADTISQLQDKWLQSVISEEYSSSFSFSQINIWIFIAPLLIGVGFTIVTTYSFMEKSYLTRREVHAAKRRKKLADTQDWQTRYHEQVDKMRVEDTHILDDPQDIIHRIFQTIKNIHFIFLTDMALRFTNKKKTVKQRKITNEIELSNLESQI